VEVILGFSPREVEQTLGFSPRVRLKDKGNEMSTGYGLVEKGSTPLAANGEHQVLLTQAGVPFSGSTGSTVLPASGAFVASAVNPCDKQRRVSLEVQYAANAATTTGAAEIIFLTSRQILNSTQSGPPLYTDDVWYIPLVTDGSVTAGALTAGTIQGGPTFTGTMSFNKMTYRPLAIELSAATANSAVLRAVIDIDVTGATWWYLQAREIGDTTNRGILNLNWSLGV
jgi:hypothetical protein